METERNEGFFFNVVKGVGTAIITALIGILVFAFIIKVAMLDDKVIKAVNQFLKILSVFLGCMYAIKGSKGLFKGGVVGVLAMLIVYLIFSLILGGMTFGTGFYIDLLFGLIVGSISGIITVNVKK